jgi:hypothetical protein
VFFTVFSTIQYHFNGIMCQQASMPVRRKTFWKSMTNPRILNPELPIAHRERDSTPSQ